MRKQLANIITCSRILGGIILCFCPTFSAAFYGLYLLCGLSDMVDGLVARKTKAVSELGARLDTLADLVFLAACFLKILPCIHLPGWLWIWIALIAALKVGTMLWGFIRWKELISLHSMLNKATGFLLFLFPLTLELIEALYSAIVLCSLATLSALHELYLVSMGRRSL